MNCLALYPEQSSVLEYLCPRSGESWQRPECSGGISFRKYCSRENCEDGNTYEYRLFSIQSITPLFESREEGQVAYLKR